MKMQHAKMMILLLTVFYTGNKLNAQDENVSERFSTQLKNNNVSGWQYTRNEPAKTVVSVNRENNTESLVAQIRKGTAPGMKFLPVPAANISARMSQKKADAKTASLASGQMQGTVTVQPMKVIPVPAQEEPKKGNDQ